MHELKMTTACHSRAGRMARKNRAGRVVCHLGTEGMLTLDTRARSLGLTWSAKMRLSAFLFLADLRAKASARRPSNRKTKRQTVPGGQHNLSLVPFLSASAMQASGHCQVLNEELLRTPSLGTLKHN